MASLADVLLPAPSKNMLGMPGKMGTMQQMIQAHPTDNTGAMTGVNPTMPDMRETLPQQMRAYPPDRIPQDQQASMGNVKQFTNMFQFVMKSKMPAQQKHAAVVNMLVQSGVQPPTVAELEGVDPGSMPGVTDQTISPEDYAKLILSDSTGEVFQDALNRMAHP